MLLYRKELLQAVRDLRTVVMTLVFPVVFYPLLFGLMGDLIGRQEARLAELVPQPDVGEGILSLTLPWTIGTYDLEVLVFEDNVQPGDKYARWHFSVEVGEGE
ncbi:hypothetical protein LR090_05875 [Candidatus Bipolaricaulota bacterium]|nr:hypothetical protein [Candidatus Bipolaricaulota bacterium]